MTIFANIETDNGTLKRIESRTYKGGSFLDLRAHFEPIPGSGSWVATKKGLTFRPSDLPELYAAIGAAIEEYAQEEAAA